MRSWGFWCSWERYSFSIVCWLGTTYVHCLNSKHIRCRRPLLSYRPRMREVSVNYTNTERTQPFNAFLSGFCAAVGQFVLTVSLRMQTSERAPSTATSSSSQYGSTRKSSTATTTKTIDGLTGEVIEEGGSGSSKYSSERAFADFVFGSLILHGFCVNFIN